jgi:hypothetical protein
LSSIYILILSWFIVTGWREGYTWATKIRQYDFDQQVFDYHAMRMIEGLIVFLLCIFSVNGLVSQHLTFIIIINLFGCWLVGNWMYEKVLRYTLNFSFHDNDKVFRILGFNIWYRWWFYELGLFIGLILLWV